MGLERDIGVLSPVLPESGRKSIRPNDWCLVEPRQVAKSENNNAMHAKPDLRVEFEPNGHYFRLGDLCRYSA